MTIRKATTEDAPAIVALIEKIHIKNLDDLTGGFLTSPDVNVKNYLDLISRRPFCYVAEVGGVIAGFIMADPFGPRWKKNYDYYIKLFSHKGFVFIERVGILPEYRHKGFGKALYERLFEDSHEKLFVACVSKNPRNTSSEIFHQNLGFKKVDEHVWDDGSESFVYALQI